MEYILKEKKLNKNAIPIKYIITENNCWECTSHKGKNNKYIQIRRDKEFKYLHRYVYELYKENIPDNLHILHQCDNPKCINIEHLTVGTHQDNMKERSIRNRNYNPKGSKNGRSKLTEEEVADIIELYFIYNMNYSEIVKIYKNITTPLIQFICKLQNWQHISFPILNKLKENGDI